MLQAECRLSVAANKLICRLMKGVLVVSSGAARVRLGLVRGGPERFRYDATGGVARQSRSIGPVRLDQPLSDWGDFLPALLTGQCGLHRIPAVGAAAPVFGFPASRPSTVLVCPVGGSGGRLLGAVFIMWDGDARPPADAALSRLMAEGKRLGMQIGVVLELCWDWPSG